MKKDVVFHSSVSVFLYLAMGLLVLFVWMVLARY